MSTYYKIIKMIMVTKVAFGKVSDFQKKKWIWQSFRLWQSLVAFGKVSDLINCSHDEWRF